jgi:hypothetical protein
VGRHTSKQACAAIKSANAGKSAADTAAGQLTEISKEFREGQRAWMGAVAFKITKYPKPFEAIVKFVNSGRTPATNIRQGVRISIHQAPLSEQPPPQFVSPYELRRGGATAPQGNSILISTKAGTLTSAK